MNIIAEVGSNWKNFVQIQGMMNTLNSCGVKLIKFQLFNENNIMHLATPVFSKYKDKIIDEVMAAQLVEFGEWLGQDVFFTPMYPEAVDICERIGVKYYKIRYADRFNFKIKDKIKSTKKPYFISSEKNIKSKMGINLFCVPKYPANRMDYFGKCPPEIFQGVSDHTSDLQYFINKSHWFDYWEMHVKEDDNCLESAWSKKIGDIKNVLV